MMEINEAERKKEKRIKRKDNLGPLRQCEMPQHLNHRSPRRRQKGHEKILEGKIAENLPIMGKEIVTQVQETQSHKLDKPKAKHPKTNINQINKYQTQRTNIKSSKGRNNK